MSLKCIKLFLLTAALGMIGVTSSQAACPAYDPAQVNIHILFGEPVVNGSQGLRDIAAISQHGDGALGERSEIPMGVTRAQLQFQSHFKILSTTQPPGSTVCAQIASFDYTFGIRDTTIFLARELGRGTCSEQEVFAHESKHVAVARGVVNDFSPMFQGLFSKMAAQIGVIEAGSSAEARAQIEEAIDRYSSGLSSNIKQIFDGRQRAIDSPEEYQRLSLACHGEMQSILHTYMRERGISGF